MASVLALSSVWMVWAAAIVRPAMVHGRHLFHCGHIPDVSRQQHLSSPSSPVPSREVCQISCPLTECPPPLSSFQQPMRHRENNRWPGYDLKARGVHTLTVFTLKAQNTDMHWITVKKVLDEQLIQYLFYAHSHCLQSVFCPIMNPWPPIHLPMPSLAGITWCLHQSNYSHNHWHGNHARCHSSCHNLHPLLTIPLQNYPYFVSYVLHSCYIYDTIACTASIPLSYT